MKISLMVPPMNITTNNGYGAAGYNMVRAMQELGHEVALGDATAPVEIAFCQPTLTYWSSPNAYHIQYTPWESTQLPQGWLEHFNNDCDEVWTPSPLIAQWYEDAGVNKRVKVFEHGVAREWIPLKRPPASPVKFLHVGSPAPRKQAQLAFDTFAETFGNSPEASLTIKSVSRCEVRMYDNEGSIIGLPDHMSNVNVIRQMYEDEQMLEMFHSHDVLVYPSEGEGFGLIPLQAMATGMPVICTSAWAPYQDFILPGLGVDSTMAPSQWPHIHPGDMFKTDKSDLKRAYQFAYDNIDSLKERAYAQAPEVIKAYDWKTLTQEALQPLVDKFAG